MLKIKFIALKELYHIMRDPRSLIIVFAMPVLMTFLYGFAINLDIENIVFSTIDYDRTPESRRLVESFYRSTYFSMSDQPVDEHDPERILREGNASAVLIIEPGFADALRARKSYSIGLLVDGSDNNLSAAVQYYTTAIVNRFVLGQLPPDTKLAGIDVSVQVLYNPDLKSSHFFVPGLVAIILLMISALLTSITIAREKETGTMEQLLTAPVSTTQILLGKIAPYILIALLDGVLVLVFAKILFDVPFRGSLLLLLGFGIIYVSASLAVGILISALVKTQQVAMMLALVATLLPSVMLSGFIFPIRNMPLLLQGLSYIVPARYFLVIIRGIMLKGAGLQVLAVQAIFLVVLMVVFMAIAARRFNTRIG